MILALTISFAFLARIAFEDFKERAIHWWLLPGFCLSLELWFWNQSQLPDLQSIIFNLGFLVFQLLVLTLYLSIKEKRWINIAKAHLGWGDILFLVCLTPLLPWNIFLVFFVVSLILALISGLILKLKTIPLAGVMALNLIALIALLWFIPLHNSNFLLLYE